MQKKKSSKRLLALSLFQNRQARFRWGILCCMAIVIVFTIALTRLQIDFNILNALPQADDVTRDAHIVLKHNPSLDRVVIDLSITAGGEDKEALVAAAEIVTSRLQESGLLKTIGTDKMSRVMPGLIDAITDNLFLMFDTRDLEAIEQSHLLPDKIDTFIAQASVALMGLEGIGQASLIAKDPLSLRYLILERFARSAFYQKAQIYKGHLISPDGNHLMLLGDPVTPSTDAAFARELTDLLDQLSKRLAAPQGSNKGPTVTLQALGAFRYALDNEKIIRRDAAKAIIFTTAGICLLLLLCFPRAYIGLLALVPAMAGAMLALFVYSLFKDQISAMALGFGGALISITVDHSIAYLLFLDRTEKTEASYASKEVWSVGLFAVLTTAGAFAVLLGSGFPLLAQLGLFAALGILFSFLFLHTVFPLLLPELKAARRPPLLPIADWLKKITTHRGWALFSIAIIAILFGAFIARPAFRVSLSSMNTVSPETRATEQLIQTQWGDVAGNIYIMMEEQDLNSLLAASDKLTAHWEKSLEKGILSSGLTPSMIFPGEIRATKNLAAWKAFWTAERIQHFRTALERAAEKHGFSTTAFQPFLKQVEDPHYQPLPIPEGLFEFFGISHQTGGSSWRLLAAATPGPAYEATAFFAENKQAGAAVFDPNFYSQQLGGILADTFGQMLLIIGTGVIVLLIFLFFDWRLVLLTLAPLIFSLIATLATLKLLGRPLDIPSLMLAIVIFGMGVDYGIFFVRSQQRFFDENHPSQGPIRTAVFLAAASTLLGMGALVFSEHAVMKSVGITSFLGIGYSVVGAFILLPPVLARLFAIRPIPTMAIEPGSSKHRRAALERFALLEPFPRFFARIKMRTDPMFPRLARLIPSHGTIVDIGCGYGVPAAWLLTLYPGLRIVGVEPDPERVRIARHVIGGQGEIQPATAQAYPAPPEPAVAALILDVAHYFSDKDLKAILEKLHQQLIPQGRLILRITMPADKRRFWKSKEESLRLRFFRRPQYLRTSRQICHIIEACGFRIQSVEPEERDEILTWFIAENGTADI